MPSVAEIAHPARAHVQPRGRRHIEKGVPSRWRHLAWRRDFQQPGPPFFQEPLGHPGRDEFLSGFQRLPAASSGFKLQDSTKTWGNMEKQMLPLFSKKHQVRVD